MPVIYPSLREHHCPELGQAEMGISKLQKKNYLNNKTRSDWSSRSYQHLKTVNSTHGGAIGRTQVFYQIFQDLNEKTLKHRHRK